MQLEKHWAALGAWSSEEKIWTIGGKPQMREREGDAHPADGLLNTDLSDLIINTPHQHLAWKCWKLDGAWPERNSRNAKNSHLSLPNESPGEIQVIKEQQI